MGTSSPFGGPGNNTPLLPDWADDDISDPFPEEGDNTDPPPNDKQNGNPDAPTENDDEKQHCY